MKSSLKVAAVQVDVRWGAAAANLEAVRQRLEGLMAEDRPELVVLPELLNSGYHNQLDRRFGGQYLRLGEKLDGPFVNGLAQLAQRYGIHLVAGIMQAHPVLQGCPYNSAVLFDPLGRVVGVQHKVHISGEETHYFLQGNELEVFHTDIGAIGLLVGTDIVFPEAARVLSLKGAEILCCPINLPKRDYIADWLYNIAAMRGAEDKVFVVAASRVGHDQGLDFLGRSCITDPGGTVMAWSETEQEEVVRAELKEQSIFDNRASSPYFRDRRPEHYKILTMLPEELGRR